MFVDIPNVIDAARDSMSRRDAMQFDQIDTVLGLSDMQTLQASLRAGEQGAVLDLGIAFTKGSMPIETMIPLGAAPDSSLLALLPPDTAMFFQLQLQETLALSKLRTFLLKAGKEMETNDFEQLFGAVEQFLGDKVDTVAQELSGHAVVGISPIDWGAMMLRTEGPRPAWPGPPVTFVVGFKEAAAGQARWKKVSAFLSKQLGPVAERQHGEIAYLEIGSRMKVAGAMLGQKLVVCLPAKSMPALIDQYLKKTPGPDVSKLADAGRKPALRLGYTPASWMLIIGGAVSVRYDGAMGHARAARGFGPKKAQKPFKPRKTTLVPPKIRTRPGVSSQLTLGRTSGMLRLRSTIGRTDYARALLGVLRQIDHMQRLSCLQNYRTLYMAYQKYEHLKGRAPASIAEIQQAWRELEIYLPRCSGERGQSSGAGYLFNPKPDAKLADADRILIYDRGDNHHGGRLLLTADGRAHWIAAADFTALARRNGLPAADPARPKKPEGADHLQRRR